MLDLLSLPLFFHQTSPLLLKKKIIKEKERIISKEPHPYHLEILLFQEDSALAQLLSLLSTQEVLLVTHLLPTKMSSEGKVKDSQGNPFLKVLSSLSTNPIQISSLSKKRYLIGDVMKGINFMTKGMVTAYYTLKMEDTTTENGRMTKCMVLVNFFTRTVR